MKALFTAALGLALCVAILSIALFKEHVNSFENHLAYEAAMGALEAQQRTVTGKVDLAYTCWKK